MQQAASPPDPGPDLMAGARPGCQPLLWKELSGLAEEGLKSWSPSSGAEEGVLEFPPPVNLFMPPPIPSCTYHFVPELCFTY